MARTPRERLLHLDPDGAGIAAGAHRVVQQVAQRASEGIGISEHDRRTVMGEGNARRRTGAGLGHERLADLDQIHRFGAQRLVGLSRRARLSRSSTRRPIRCVPRATSASSWSRRGRGGCSRRSVSIVDCSAAIGVRSSWEASARNRRIAASDRVACATASSSESTIASNDAAICPSSVPGRRGRRRWRRSPAAMPLRDRGHVAQGPQGQREASSVRTVAAASTAPAAISSVTISRLTALST